MVLEYAFFSLAFWIGILMGGIVGGLLSEMLFGLDSSNDRFFITAGAAGGVILAAGLVWGVILPLP